MRRTMDSNQEIKKVHLCSTRVSLSSLLFLVTALTLVALYHLRFRKTTIANKNYLLNCTHVYDLFSPT